MENVTFLDVLVASIKAAGHYNQNDQIAPAIVLWPDETRQWEPLLPELRQRLPLLTLGEYEPEQRIGPAYWIRCMISRTLPDDPLPDDAVPIIYLPGFGKQALRAIEECPLALQPLAELQYRGSLWIHRNGRDWTVSGFLHTLDIPVAGDKPTREALARALPQLAGEPLSRLRKEAPLRAEFFNELLHPDAVRQMLLWLSGPGDYQKQLKPDEWAAFCALCAQKFGVHPMKDGPLTAAEKLGTPAGEWTAVWERYAEAPYAYPGLPELLVKAQPKQLPLFREPLPYWPQDNEQAEAKLRERLAALRQQPANEARTAIYSLDTEHGKRRGWVWAKLGKARLAEALEHLNTLAQMTKQPLGGAETMQIASSYADWGWQVDEAVLEALAAVEDAQDVAAVKSAIIPLYRPWLEKATGRFQDAVLQEPVPNYVAGSKITAETGTCIVFTDALRFDLGQQLATQLTENGFVCETGWQLAALPPVTSTAKPAISPAAGAVSGGDRPGLVPVNKQSGTTLGTELLRKLIRDLGYQELKGDELGDPGGIAWTEYGAIDRYGHDHGWKIAHHAQAELRGLSERVAALLNQGWRRVMVITDHGWLLLPDGLPKAELPQHLTVTRKGRCAVLKTGTDTDYRVVPWHWDNDVRIAIAPDIHCFEAGKEYEHGGLSPQECVVPVITARRAVDDAELVIIEEIKWRGLRCNVQLSSGRSDLQLDIRLKAADAGTTVCAVTKTPDENGSVSLLVPDEELEGSAAVVVVLRGEAIQAQRLTVVGGD